MSEPPYASYETHYSQGSPGQLPHSRLVDSRWANMVNAHLKEIDDMIEWRRRLERRPGLNAARDQAAAGAEEGVATAEPDPKGKGKRRPGR